MSNPESSWFSRFRQKGETMDITCSSISTDKLVVVCDTIKEKILSDETLKTRVKTIKIEWDSVYSGDEVIAVPSVDIQFKD